MTKIEFEKLLKEKTPKQIIRMHCNWVINLTNKQLDKVIELKNRDVVK